MRISSLIPPIAALLTLAGSTAAAQPSAGCETPADPAAISAAADGAQRTFTSADAGGFQDALQQIRADAGCLRVALPPSLAARAHTALALEAFLAQREEAVIGAFQSALAADPSTEVESWMPEMHPIHLQYQLALRLEPEPATPLHRSTDGQIWIDGVEARALAARPALIQLHEDGQFTRSVLWAPGDPLPGWAPLAPERLPPEARRRLWLGGATAGSAIAAGALLAISAASYTRYTDIDTPYGDLDALQRRANWTGAGAVGAAAMTAGFGAARIVNW